MPEGAKFGAAATLKVSPDPASLRQARAEIEDELGDVTVGVASSNGGPAALADGGRMGAAIDDGAMLEHLSDQTDVLEDILDELERGGIGGTGGGGGMSTIVPTPGSGSKSLLSKIAPFAAGLGLPFVGGEFFKQTHPAAETTGEGIAATSPLPHILAAASSVQDGLNNVGASEGTDQQRSNLLSLLEDSPLLNEQQASQIREEQDLPEPEPVELSEGAQTLIDNVPKIGSAEELQQLIENTPNIGPSADLKSLIDSAPELQLSDGAQSLTNFLTGGAGRTNEDGGPATTGGAEVSRAERAEFNQTDPNVTDPRTPGGTTISQEDRAIFNQTSSSSDSGSSGSQVRTQRVDATIQNTVEAQFDISNIRELQAFLNDPEGYIRDKIRGAFQGGP